MANEFKVRKGLVVNGSGSVILDVQGSQGQLFSVTDVLSGSLFAVKDISGMPIIEAFSDDRVNIGTFNREAIKVSGSVASVTGSFTGSFTGSLFGTASQALTASYALGGSASSILFQTASAATTWSFNHFLQTQYPVFTIYDEGNNVIVPQQITAVDTSSALIYFSSPKRGVAVASKGGYSASVVTSATTANTAISASFASSGTGTFSGSFSGSYQGNFSGSLFGTASQATSASFAFTASSAISSSLSQTASFAINAFSASNALTASFVNTLNQDVNINGSISVTTTYNTPTIFRNISSYAININDTYTRSALTLRPSNSGTETVTFSRNVGSIQIQSVTTASVAQNLSLNPFGGNVGIGTESPSTRLDVSGSTRVTNNLTVSGSTQITGSLGITGSISTSANATIGGTLSAAGIQNVRQFNTDTSFLGGSISIGKQSIATAGYVLDVSGSALISGSVVMSGSYTQNGFKILTAVSQSLNFANDASAAAGGVPLGGLYRSGNFILIRLS